MENLEKATDMELAFYWALHIDNPCGVEVNGKLVNIRNFYINETKKIMPTLTNPFAKNFLQMTINKYN